MKHSKITVVLAALLTASMFAGIGLLTVNAVGTGENDTASANKIKFFQFANGAGADGYDVVAYFEESRARKGSPNYETEWGGVIWRFASPENQKLFLAAPAKYAPQYGGHCAYGVAQGYLVRGDPSAWSVRDNKLYLNYNSNIRTAWIADAANFIRRAGEQWPKLNR
ncbi:MAG: YHS domain protein [Betaproteobacteria bacterium]|nr:YHS domain protein [Betaproteobacteria bacterium]